MQRDREGLDEPLRRVRAARELEAEHAAVAVEERARVLVPGRRGEAGVVDAFDDRVRGERVGDGHRRSVLLRDAEGQRLDPALEQVARVRIEPAAMSLCPLRYFVPLWSDRSKPCSAGRKFTGLASVLSIIETSSCSRANVTTAFRSGTVINGFVIDST